MLSGVSYSEVPLWINASHVLLLTSLHEGSPMVVKEALACGVPVVSVDVGDVAERISGVEGCHIARPDPGDLAVKLTGVWSRGERVDAEKASQALSLGNIAQQLKVLLRRTIQAAIRWRAPSGRIGGGLSARVGNGGTKRISTTILVGTSIGNRPVQRHFAALGRELINSGIPSSSDCSWPRH